MGKTKPNLITKGRYQLKFRGTECLNCGHPLDISDRYCPNCSQANSTKKLVLKDFFDEFFSNLINYDSKLLQTLYALLIRPGTITKDYINGKRVAYTNPFRFLLSLAFLYLLIFTYNDRFSAVDKAFEGFDEKLEQAEVMSLNLTPEDSLIVRKETEKVLSRLDSIEIPETNISEQLKLLDSIDIFDLEKKSKRKDSLIKANPRAYFKSINDSTGWSDVFSKMEFFARKIKQDTLRNFSDAMSRYGAGNNFEDKIAFNSSNSLRKAIREPGSFLNATISKLPFVIFFFLPVFTIFIWVVYIRKKYTYTDHLIFSFHNQSLLFILLILSLIIDSIFDTASSGMFLLIFGIYLYKSMRKFYGQGRFKTIVKYIFLNTIFTFLAVFVVIILLTGSAFTY
ncbi:DUF3667 domain-containing protein [Flagellimonas sp. HMM57]|uniref:DUF3667 domain-containing protein n=1 Tax=unclassified Flagellimonas TaxID=2644544 RepID=UPI0013D85BE4|nr:MULTISPECIES: DUF3667 domain-containing protein [unclassified Flagellimonas]UII76735.1 DUF3667 domain-containing protein [Flagellimonas sp. HMM57]